MNHFRYKLIRDDGRMSGGVAELPFTDDLAVRTYFEQRGMTVVSVRRLHYVLSFFYGIFSALFRKKISDHELIELLMNLSVTMRSGVPLLSALQDSLGYSQSVAVKKVVEDLHLSFEAGLSFSQATDRYPKIFPEIVRYLIRIGEESGTLEKTLQDSANHLSSLRNIKTGAKKAMLYPTFVFAATIGAAIFWLYYVVPDIVDLFKQMQVTLPAITVFLINLSNFMQSYLHYMLIGMFAFVLLIVTAIRYNYKVRKGYHWLLLKLPITKVIVSSSNLAYISEYFSLLISSGVNVLRSLEVMEGAISNLIYREKLIQITEGIKRGNTLTEEFRRAEIYPGFVVRMIAVGEQSGRLPEQLAIVAQEYQKRLKDTVDNLGELVKPIAILIVGGLFIFIIVALFLPIYQLIGQISQGR